MRPRSSSPFVTLVGAALLVLAGNGATAQSSKSASEASSAGVPVPAASSSSSSKTRSTARPSSNSSPLIAVAETTLATTAGVPAVSAASASATSSGAVSGVSSAPLSSDSTHLPSSVPSILPTAANATRLTSNPGVAIVTSTLAIPTPTPAPNVTDLLPQQEPTSSASSSSSSDVAYTTTLLVTAGPGGGPPAPAPWAGVENGATIYFPGAGQFWVTNSVAVVQWAPALGVPVDVWLANNDTSVLPYTLTLSSRVYNTIDSLSLSVGRPALPGEGYVLMVVDSGNQTVYATSQEFELKKQGSSPVLPPGYSESISASAQSGGSGAGRRAALPPWWGMGTLGWVAGVVAGGAGVLTGVVV